MKPDTDGRSSSQYDSSRGTETQDAHLHLAQEIHLAERDAQHAQDVVGSRRVEVEVGKREGQQEVLVGERHLPLPKREHHRLVRQRLDFGLAEACESAVCLGDQSLEARVIRVELERGRSEDTFLQALHRTPGMMGDRHDLEMEWHHVFAQAGLDDVPQVEIARLRMGSSLLQDLRHAVQHLQIATHACVIEGNGHVVLLGCPEETSELPCRSGGRREARLGSPAPQREVFLGKRQSHEGDTYVFVPDG